MASLLDNPLDRFFKGSPYLVRQGMGLAWARGARSRRWSLRTSCASAAASGCFLPWLLAHTPSAAMFCAGAGMQSCGSCSAS